MHWKNCVYRLAPIFNGLKCHRKISCVKQARPRVVLGIETSCDDTGAAVVDENGKILGEDLCSQTSFSVKMGGVSPPLARNLHRENISSVVANALKNANIQLKDIDAIATTVKPGSPTCLMVGMNHTKELLQKVRKSFIPIHHMEAHALTARMTNSIEFPFLVLLISGGHCLLAVARGVDDFVVLGKSIDTAPGELLDKVARRLKLKNMKDLSEVSGGRAIEVMAQNGDISAFKKHEILVHQRDCNFSFGLVAGMYELIAKEEEKYGIKGGNVLPNASDICASLQYTLSLHLAKRLQRAFLVCEHENLLPRTHKTLVLSGGVASNAFIRRCLENLCYQNDCQLICPPPKLCTDNGVMIAWNGMEKLLSGKDFSENIEQVQIQSKCPLGEDWTDKVEQLNLKVGKVKILDPS